MLPQQLTFRTLQPVPSGPPQEIEVNALSSRTALLMWQPTNNDQLNGVLTGYVINVTEIEIGNQNQIVTQGAQYTFHNLNPFYHYSFLVAAVTVGQGPFSAIFSLQMPQDVPTAPPVSIEVTLFNSSALSIGWRPPSAGQQNGIIEGYTVRLVEVITGNERVIDTGGPHTEVFVTSLHPHYVYELSVAAQTVGVGPYSSPTVIQMDEDIPSGPPTNVTATSLSSTSIKLTWMPPPLHNQNGIIREYIIHYYVSETRESVVKQSPDNYTSTIITDLHPYYTYSFEVAAVTVGAGPLSTEFTIRTLESEPTGAPQAVESVAVSSSSVRLTWNPPLPEEQNGMIRSYHINVTSVDDKNLMEFFETDGLNTIFIINSLHPYYLYTITIAAFTVDLGPHATVQERTHPEIPSGAPMNLTVVALNSSTTQVSWDPPLSETQNGPISGYVVQISGINTDEDFEIQSYEGPNTFTVSNLHPFYAYAYTIAAIGTGIGPYSTALVFQMPEEVCTAVVRNVTVDVLSATSVAVSWLPPYVQSWNGVITSYTIIYELLGKVNGGSSTQPIQTDTLVYPQPGMMFNNDPDPRASAQLPLQFESVKIGLLEEFYVYQFSVYLENSVGISDASQSIGIEMPPAAPSGPPSSVTALALSSTSILVTWDNPDDFDANGIITAFEIILKDSSNHLRNFTQPPSAFSFHLEGLNKYAEYRVELSAQNSEGRGPFSNPVFINTLEDVPSAPVDIGVESVNSTAVAIKWSPPLSPNGILLFYKITYDGYKISEGNDVNTPENEHSVPATGGNSAVLFGLQSGFTYSFEVRANTSVGFGDGSQVTFQVADAEVDKSETGNEDGSTPAITATAIVAGLAFLVLIVLVTALLWRRIKRKHKFKLRTGLHFDNLGAKAGDEAEGNLYMTLYRKP
ncbi:Tyrosine-protein phosphatase Lar [Geodia barretti]|nr:Tyrosine-protein phosphatase Lar [Geodia barretti]